MSLRLKISTAEIQAKNAAEQGLGEDETAKAYIDEFKKEKMLWEFSKLTFSDIKELTKEGLPVVTDSHFRGDNWIRFAPYIDETVDPTIISQHPEIFTSSQRWAEWRLGFESKEWKLRRIGIGTIPRK